MSKNLPQTPCKRQALSIDSLEAIYQDITRLLDLIIIQSEVTVEVSNDCTR